MSVSDGVTPDEGEWPFAKIGSTLRIRCPTRAELDAEAAVRDAKITPEEGEWPKRDAVPFVPEDEKRPGILDPEHINRLAAACTARVDFVSDDVTPNQSVANKRRDLIPSVEEIAEAVALQKQEFEVTQDATSSHTLTSWPSNMSFAHLAPNTTSSFEIMGAVSNNWLTSNPSGIRIDCETGAVMIPEGLTLTDAARAFWDGVGQIRAVPFVREAKVTPEMLADAEEFEAYFASDFNTFAEIAAEIYRAMHAAAPVEFCPEDRSAALERERDAAYAMRNEAMEALVQMRQDRDVWQSIAGSHESRLREAEGYSHSLAVAHDQHHGQLDALRAELQAAHDLLAQRPAPVPDTPKPAVVIREHRHDPRRMGSA